MPIYEYRCESCGHTLDALQKIADAPLTNCPSCDEAALKRLMSAPSFRLKGKGWYETDFKSDKERKRNLADLGDRADGEGKADTAAKEKPDKKVQDKPSADAKTSATGGKASAGAASKASQGRQSGTEAA
ncbi:FmdB family zinc ribbon protein [Candidatus Rariloculus sp.]|uniref:FmdB family zinc ribbon protein n=1 Tax=Candidatus Rariloculus sp. TaxID=3101265 RepID=UPI003D0980C7